MSGADVQAARPPAGWHSLRWRLPLLIFAIVAVVAAAFLWTAHREVELTLVQAGGDRARAAADQVASILERNTQQGVEPLRRAASAPGVLRYLSDPTAENQEAARASLTPLAVFGPRWITLWDANGASVLSVFVPLASQPDAPPHTLTPPTHPPKPGLGELQRSGEGVYVDSAAEIREASPSNNGRRLGTLSVRSTIIVSPPGAVARLVGGSAVVTIGNRAGGVWTDLSHILPPPPVDLTRDGVAEYRLSTGEGRLGAMRGIRGTPWNLWIEFPRSVVVAPAGTFLKRMLGLAAVIVLAATVLVRFLTTSVTTPLAEMTDAAETIAAGDYSRRVRPDRLDEIGRLGQAFNLMAQQVGEAHQGLETRVRDSHETLEALRESEARHRAIVDVAFDCIITIDGHGIVSEFNPAAEKTFGYRRADALGRKLTDLIVPPSLRSAHEKGLARYLATGEGPVIGKLIEITAMRSDGTEFPVELAITVVSSEPAIFTGMVRDITERKSLEQQFRQSQRMDAIGQLAGGVAHDFNNLLTAILGYSALLLDDLEPDNPRRSDILEIRKAGESAAALTRQLLAFSRRQIFHAERVDLNQIVRRLEALLKRVIGEDIRLQAVLSPDLANVVADPGQIEQIIMNLAVNARDAMPTGGQLTIETANVDLAEVYARQHPDSAVGPHVMLAVGDTGIGMDAPTQAQIFEPFFTTKERGKGTGLGLSTVYGIVKQSGGSIWVSSEPGRGATFKIYLPRAEHATARAAATVKRSTTDGTETILLAEDQAEVRAVTRTALQRHGYTVLDACHGEEALRIVQEHRGPIHLLITDVVMPSMSGRELVGHLHQSRPEIRVLYASGYTDDAIIRHGVLDAGVAFLQKPFTPSVLLRKVREVLDT